VAYANGGRKIPGSVEFNVGGELPGDDLGAAPPNLVTKLNLRALVGRASGYVAHMEGPQNDAQNQDCQQRYRNQETAIQADPGRGHVSGS